MSETLYQRLIRVDSIESTQRELERLGDERRDFETVTGFGGRHIENILPYDCQASRKRDMGQYEENPVFRDAIKGRQSIEESLKELAQINQGIRKILPRRKNRAHNERLEQLGQLISIPDSFSADGILIPDNVITGSVEATAALFTVYSFCELIWPKITNTDFPMSLKDMLFFSVTPSLLFGGLINFLRSFYPLQGGSFFEEAKYVDQKIQEFYG